ncbi:MAG: thioredoxin domain-containing protein [Draconibacterium sp.]
MKYVYTNNLIHSTSPYLLQHAHNPVNWQPWSDNVIEQAKRENKLILISVGYAACHWCHVMEHECFENEDVAKVMNENFICVKVDREERPDVDHYYMTAVQLMNMQGGWPLNVIALPDGRPIWGGTYFPKESWMKNLNGVADFYRDNQAKTEEYAESLQQGIEQNLLVDPINSDTDFDAHILETAVENWSKRFDMENGGRVGAPKFPMPTNLEFLLYYGFVKKDKLALDFVETTLVKMARGGIYDQIGGGFARYSVDGVWKVPHFEKMLYDNGQLLSIYSKGFQQFRNNELRQVVYETTDFIERELMDKSGAFYSSLDADSEGEEGKFYVWSSTKLEQLIGEDYPLFAEYYNVNGKGLWEEGNNILLKDISDQEFAQKHGLSENELNKLVSVWKRKLMNARAERIRPGLDDKTLTSWNALVIQGLTDAYKTFHDEKFLDLALKNAVFIKQNIFQPDGKLFHSWKNGVPSIHGFLEDYALVVQSFISLFEATGDEEWLFIAKKLTEYTINHFHSMETGLFYFSERNENEVLTNHFQKEDNVVPAANSVMANNLHKLYLIFGNTEYRDIMNKMPGHVITQFSKYPMAYSNWGILMLKLTFPYYEVAVCGDDSKQIIERVQNQFQPQILWAFSENKSEVPIFKDRLFPGKNLIYVCQEGVCKLPVQTAEEALGLLYLD